jgi:hypothetical protein
MNDEVKKYLPSLLRLHRIVKDLGMNEHDIHNVFELAKYNELQNLQWNVEYLRKEIGMLEVQKTNCTNHILKLNRKIEKRRNGTYESGIRYQFILYSIIL